MRLLRRSSWFAAVATLAGCGDPEGPGPDRLEVQLVAPASLAIGDSVQLEPRYLTNGVVDPDGSSAPAPPLWRSLDASIASVSGTGMLRGLAVGTARIEVAAGSAADTAQVRIDAVPRGLRLVLPRDSAIVGEGLRATAVLLLDGLGGVIDTARGVTFSSSDTLTLAVDPASGASTALRDGTVDYIARLGELAVWAPVRAVYHEPLAGSVPAGATITHVGVTREFGCARASNGQVLCWGQSGVPRFGNGLATQTSPLTPASSGLTFEEVRVARGTACARASGGSVHCWGTEQVITGPGAATPWIATPTRLPLPDSAGAIAELVPGWFFDECARNVAGRLWCWGDNTHAAIGPLVAADSTLYRPRRLEGAPALVRASIGEGHGCGVTEAGALWCWGDPSWPYHPEPGKPTSRVPEPVATPRPVRDVAVVFQSTCTIDDAGAIDCWGYNQGGAVDARVSQDGFVGRTRVDIPGNFVRIRAGGAGVCAITDQRDLWCWGAQRPSALRARAPFRFSMQHKFLDFAIGSHTSVGVVCGLTTTGRVLCNHRWSAE